VSTQDGARVKILLIKPSSFGDVVQALPVASGLKRRWPDAQVHWIVADIYAPLLQGHPAIDQIILYPRKRWTSPLRLPEMLTWAGNLRDERYDVAIDLQGLFRSGLMTWVSGAKRKIGLKSAREGAGLFYNEQVRDDAPHAAERYLQALRHLDIEPEPYDFQLTPRTPLPPEISKPAYVVLHPYTRWITKLWPWRYYQELADAMPQTRFVVVGQGAWFPLSGPNLIDLRNRTPLPELISILAKARAVLSPDSGPAHLAAALGVPTLVLFGATDWRKTRPYGARVHIEAAALPCSPCLLRECPRVLPVECMGTLTPEQVKEKLSSIIHCDVPVHR
jgi:heptosyltransferase-1